MKETRYPCVVETRLTYDHGGTTGMHADYPLGLFNTVTSAGRSVEIDHGQWPIMLQLDFRPGWAIIMDVQGTPMWKFRPPETVEPDYREYQFHSCGKLYILEFRFDSLPEQEPA